MTNAEKGRYGEDIASHYLENCGCRIEARNWHFPGGELDIVCWQNQTLVIVEVKLRGSDTFGMPEEAVTDTKKQRLLMGTAAYLNALALDCECRVDVIAVQLAPSGRVWRLDHYKGAVWHEG